MTLKVLLAPCVALTLLLTAAAASAEITIAHVYGKTGPYAAYAKQSHDGLMLGLEYATDGTMEINGEPIVVIEKDTGLRPAAARDLLREAFGEEGVDLAVGGITSEEALAMLPVAQEFARILIVEPAQADAITGEHWNRHVFRTAPSTGLEAVANARALGGPDVAIATLAPEYPFARDWMRAFRTALPATGARLVHEEYATPGTRDFTAAARRLFAALDAAGGRKRLFILWAGGGHPLEALLAMKPETHGIELAGAGGVLAALVPYKAAPGLEGAISYYYQLPDNEVNDWLLREHLARFEAPPDVNAAGGMAAGIAIVEAIRRAETTETEALIAAMEGLEWFGPKGLMRFRPGDHQALQAMYHFRIRTDPRLAWGVPELVRELAIGELDLPLRSH
ncbi:MAG: ABC transporter permease [Alphaproteobacteria bacterium]|nr:MAG: ABC transporter permease [Alphaproteobacteria bacterium]